MKNAPTYVFQFKQFEYPFPLRTKLRSLKTGQVFVVCAVTVMRGAASHIDVREMLSGDLFPDIPLEDVEKKFEILG